MPALEFADASENLELDALENGGADGKGKQLFSDILEQRDIVSRDRSHVSAAESSRFRQFMKEQGNADIVRDAKLILKDEATGEIKLILKPERLGEVRIRLSLEDNRIAGRIIVENNNIRAYFEENMADLLEEFRENGFEHAGLDVSVRQDSGRRQKGQERHISQSAAASVFNEHVPDSGYAEIDSLINLVV